MRVSTFVVAGFTAMYVYKKVPANLTGFHASLWAGRGQNTVCPWQFIRKSHQHAGIKRLSFFVVAGLTAMYVI